MNEINTNWDRDPLDDEETLGSITVPLLVKEVSSLTTRKASDFGAFSPFTVPQAGIGAMPVQLLQRRIHRDEAIIINNGGVTSSYSSGAQNWGSAAAPVAFTQIAATGSVIQPGAYTINWIVELSGALTAGTDNDNFQLYNATTNQVITTANIPAVAGAVAQVPVTITVTAVTNLRIRSGGNAATAGSVYAGSLSVTPVYATGTGVTQTGGFPIVLSHRPDTLQSATPIGLTLPQGQQIKIVSQQPVYAVALGGQQPVSVLDESWDVK